MYICHKVEPGSQSFLMLYIVWCFGLPGTERKTPPSAPEADLIRRDAGAQIDGQDSRAGAGGQLWMFGGSARWRCASAIWAKIENLISTSL